jgi:2-(1,2-epoxy-1,2-dihydrophenyl)acetyl-CoA isomerase
MQHIHTTREGPVGIIAIDRRDRFNSMDVETAQQFRKAGLQYARDDDVRCVVVRGEGGVFCSGADLKYIRERGDATDFGYLQPEGVGPAQGYGESFKQILEYIHSTISEIKRAPKPFVAAVDGIAAAGGFGIAMACDLVVASERASFEWAYHKTGLTGAESSTFFLPRLVGLRKALELVLLNPRLTAKEAKEAGLITAVFPNESFETDTLALARRLAAGPTAAYAVAKRLLNQAAGVDQLDYHLDQELQHLARIADTPDFAEGLAAFFGKRAPAFAGR